MNSHGSSVSSSFFIITSAGAYTHNISILFPIVGAGLKKRDRCKRDFQYLLVNCSGTEITRKEGHLSRLLLIIGKFPLFWRKTFPKMIIAAEKI